MTARQWLKGLTTTVLTLLVAAVAAALWLRWWPRPADLPAPKATTWASPTPRLVLVLGAGGPRGIAHLGVLKALEELGVQPDAVVGASAGAIVGALWLAGHRSAQLEQMLGDEPLWWHWLDWADDFTLRLRGDAFAAWARERAAPLIETLPKPFAAVATDAQTGRSFAFTQGDLGRALHASSATPALFAPARIDGSIYVDGNQSSPVPVQAARALGAQRVVAVDVSAHLESTPKDIPMSWREGDVQTRRLSDAQTKNADLLIHPDLGYYAGGSAAYRAHVVRLAYEATMREAPRLRALAGP
jgi:NTE family protein